MSRNSSTRQEGYLDLLRHNRDFRLLWVGQVISESGDWFNSVALFTLMLNLTGASEAVGYILIIKLLPTFLVGPLAGVVADRFNRKTILIAADVVRGIVVLGFLFIDSPEQVWMVYGITALQVVGASFFDPARSAAVPGLVTREQLISANALSSVTWSATLALGAALGGIVTDTLGRDTAFIIDSLSFFLSAAVISFVRFPRREPRERRIERLSLAEATGITDLVEGARYLRSSMRVTALLLVKSGWGMGGGVLLLLTVFGKQVFPIGNDGSTSIGLLYAARGAGALIGPIIARAITGTSIRTMRQAIAAAFFLSTAFYLLFAHSPVLSVAALFVIGAHAGGSIQWVFSTTLLQMAVPDRFLGRVFALDMALLTLTMSVSTYLTGWAIDSAGLDPRRVATLLGFAFFIPGLAWLAIQPWMNRQNPESRIQNPEV